VRDYAKPTDPVDKLTFAQHFLLGLGGIVTIGGLIVTFLTFINAQRLETERAKAAQGLETQRAEAELVQEYLQGMETLVIDNKLPEFNSDTDDREKNRTRRAAQAQTLATLRSVEDPDRKQVVIMYLDESELIKKPEPIVGLSGAKLEEAELSYVGLGEADLSYALLTNAKLIKTSLKDTYLYGAKLDGAVLRDANLTGADLGWTDLTGADLREANLTEADLRDAVGITKEELEQQTNLLEGATMPDGTTPD